MKETRASLKTKVLKEILYVFEQETFIPLGSSAINERDLNAERMVKREGNSYFLYELNNHSDGDYEIKKISQNQAERLIEGEISKLNKTQLQQEYNYWVEYANILKEEVGNFVFSSETLVH